MKLIIIEGVDLTGKSTACHNFLQRFAEDENVVGWYMGMLPKENSGDAYREWKKRVENACLGATTLPLTNYENYSLNKNSVVICDRSFIGSYVYGNYYKDQPTLKYSELIELFKILSKHFEAIHINLFTCSAEEFIRRYASRGDSYVKEADLMQLQQYYNIAFKELSADLSYVSAKIKVNVLEKDIDQEAILNFITSQK